MENRKIVDEKIKIRIGKQLAETYKKEWTWKDLIETEGVLPTDIAYNFGYIEEPENGFGKMDGELENYYYPYIEVIRKRLETDDEYLKRKQSGELFIRQQEEKDKLEYLRLKAKFES